VSTVALPESPSYRGYRYAVEIISHAVWLYFRFGLSLRDVEELLAEQGATVTYETNPSLVLKARLQLCRGTAPTSCAPK
jgi:transposase-like protein